MDKINTKIRVLFFFALALSIGFPLGVLGIIFGAINGITALLVLGIIFAVAGFYGMPLLWVGYGEKRRYRSLLLMIETEHLYTVSALAAQTGYSEKEIREKINKMIISRELVGYLFIDDMLVLNNNEKQKKREPEIKQHRCECCGAMMIYEDGRYKCEYCLYSEAAEKP